MELAFPTTPMRGRLFLTAHAFSLVDSAVIFFVLTFLVLAHIQRTRRRYASLPPGPKKRFLTGNLKDMPTSYEHETYQKWGKEHGSDILHLGIAGTSIIILNSFDSALDLLDRRSAIYSGRARFPMVTELMGWDFLLGFMPYGVDWRYHRRLFQQSFTPKATARFYHQEREAVQELLQRLLDKPDGFLSHFRQIILKLGAAWPLAAYGLEVLPECDLYVAAAEEAVHSIALAVSPAAFLVNALPILKYVPEWFPGAAFQRKAREWRVLAQRMVDLPFWAAMQNITVTAIATFCLGVLFNPEAQRKAQCEIDGLLRQGRLPDFIDEESLPNVTAVVKESIRWRTVPPLGEFTNYRLPAGSIVNAWAMLHDETIYPDPFKFNPDRFMKDGQLDLDVKDPVVAAFGFGRRICPGRHMAYSSAKDENGMVIEPSEGYTTGLVSFPEPFRCSIAPRSKEAEVLIRNL
ncbi:cytochrome P450 [Hymenopellis radicata]|nr:cytochrome P450 [Hymenopellis radicata]